MSIRRADEYIQIAKEIKMADSAILENFKKSTLLLLSSKSTPETAKQELIEKASNGEQVSYKEAQELVKAHKEIADMQSFTLFFLCCKI
jgi:hypothetical protein